MRVARVLHCAATVCASGVVLLLRALEREALDVERGCAASFGVTIDGHPEAARRAARCRTRGQRASLVQAADGVGKELC